MKIELTHIKIRDLFEGYKDSQENGVVAYGGRLDVRPAYQREFVYDDKQRDAVIHTVMQGFPLNVMYWCKKDDGNFEVLDGQQRTLSICQYMNHDFSVKDSDGHVRIFNGKDGDEIDEAIKDYELMVYICEGPKAEKLEWFKTINIAGEELSDQELRNAVYSGAWVSEAKRWFSKRGCAGQKISEKYIKKEVIRQELLQTAIDWIATTKNQTIDEYMAHHQHDVEIAEMWDYFRDVIHWIESTFKVYRKAMLNVDWASLYRKYGDGHYNVDEIEDEVARLMADDDVTKQSGIYQYVFDHDERHLSIRAFSKVDKQRAYEKQNGKCPVCGLTFKIEEMEADHIVPWSKGGHTLPENCQCLCKDCNRKKSNS